MEWCQDEVVGNFTGMVFLVFMRAGTPGKVNKNDHEYVDQLLLLLAQGKAVVSIAFFDDVDMSRALWVRHSFVLIKEKKVPCIFSFPLSFLIHSLPQRGMEKVLNKDEAHPELIATYMDNLAKGKHGKDTINEDDIISYGNTALDLLRYVAVWCAGVFSRTTWVAAYGELFCFVFLPG
jgi:hypothetical protein